jgi:hypothetical protein
MFLTIYETCNTFRNVIVTSKCPNWNITYSVIRYKRPIGKNVRPSQFFNPTDCIYTVYTFPKIGLKPISTQISTRFQQTDVLKTNILITK